jgi:aspartyl-tRNA(Asn)/glutamyl-tRNA(Gln) amidotransferase subunit B
VGGEPNSRVCPVCLGMPGVLPVLSREVVERGIRVALAVDATVAERTGFARKNYFYPDLPKGYQITQHDAPLATDGHLDIETAAGPRRVRIRQVHIEEDAGKTVHAERDGRSVSLVDMNRCGVPLVEIVTHPDIRSVEEADLFLTSLRRILVFLGVATGNMHEGSLRFDTNVSVRPRGSDGLHTPTEIKNLNSFRAVRKALRHEIDRQSAIVAGGGEVVHETLLWDETAERVTAMRSKEIASDYRYFPEPDLLDVAIDDAWLERARARMPELPVAMRERFRSWYGLPEYDAGVLTAELPTAVFYEVSLRELLRLTHPEFETDGAPGGTGDVDFDSALEGRSRLSELGRPEGAADLAGVAKTVSNWVMGTLGGWLNASDGVDLRELASTRMPPSRFARVLRPRIEGDINEPAARRLFEEAIESADPIDVLIERLGLSQLSDEAALDEVVRHVLESESAAVERYRAGETKLLGHFMGLVMKETGGRADPAVAAGILNRLLESV